MKKSLSTLKYVSVLTYIGLPTQLAVVLSLIVSMTQLQAQKIAMSEYHVSVWCGDGSVYTWGSNTQAEHGDGSASSSLAATRLNYVGPISGIFAHQAGGALVTPTGEVYAWGAFTNHWLTLGVPSWQLVEATPRKVTSVSDVRSVLGYSTEFLFITKDDSVLVTGRNNAGQYGNGTESSLDSGYAIVQISEVEHVFFNRLSFFAIKKDGTLWGWGGNGYAMIDSSGREKVTTPIQMMPELRFRTGCSSRDNQYRFVTVGGDLVVWGFNRFGMMGTTEAFVSTPRTVLLPRRVVTVAGGINHTAMLLDDGTVVSFGSNEHGQLGRLLDANGNLIESSSTPVVASGLNDVVEIAAWGNTTFALTRDGNMYGWGENRASWIKEDGPRTFPFPERIVLPCEITTSVSESPHPERFSIHPNPAHQSIDVHFSNHDRRGFITIFTMHGIRVLGPVALQEGDATVQIASLETGVYHVVLNTSKGLQHRQLVVLR